MNLLPQTCEQPVKILLVDDDEGDILLTQKGIQRDKLNIEMDVVFDGVEALQYLRSEEPFQNSTRPDLVLLDLNMPRKDGKTTLKEMKSDEDLASIPVVVLTTSDADREVIKSFGMQASCYVTKPVDRNQFTLIIESLQPSSPSV
jgi:two-component system response regulator